MSVPFEAFTTLQQDFGAEDCRHSLIQHLRHHESEIDPNTPISNYLSSQFSTVEAIVPLQALTPQRRDRMVIAKVLLRQLFGKDANWGAMKTRWNKSVMYHAPKGAQKGHVGVYSAIVVVLLGITISTFIGLLKVEISSN